MNRAVAAAAILLVGLAGPVLAASATAGPAPQVAAAPLEPTPGDASPEETPPPPPPEPGTVPVTLTDVSPHVLTPGEDLRLTMTLHNTDRKSVV